MNEHERTDAGAAPRAPAGSWFRSGAERAGTWLSDEALTGLLVVLAVDTLVLPVFGKDIGNAALDIVFAVLLLTGLAAVSGRRVTLIVFGLLVSGTLILRWIVPAQPGKAVAVTASSLASLALLALLVFLRTLSPGPITRHRIEGAVATYLLVAMTFALAYELVETMSPGSLRFAEGEPEPVGRTIGYFSLVTLTTVGYGDITPVTPLARRLAMAEGLIGQLYPAIIIGWMISSMTTRRKG